jgi:hypothetical protein
MAAVAVAAATASRTVVGSGGVVMSSGRGRIVSRVPLFQRAAGHD